MCDPPRIYPPYHLFICATLPESTLPSQNIPPPPLISQFICATLPESTFPSQNIPPLSANLYVRPSQNLPLPLRIYPPFQQIYMCDPPRIYPSLPECTPLFNKFICVTLSEFTPPSQNIPTLSANLYVRPSQNLPLPEYTPLLTNVYVRPSQNLSLPPRIYPPYQPIYMCDPPRTYPSLPEYTPLFNKYICVRPSQNLLLPPRIYPPSQQLNATLLESTPPSQSIPPFFQQLCATLRIYAPSFQNKPTFSTTVCDRPRTYPQRLCTTISATPPSQNISTFQQQYHMLPSQNKPPFSTTRIFAYSYSC